MPQLTAILLLPAATSYTGHVYAAILRPTGSVDNDKVINRIAQHRSISISQAPSGIVAPNENGGARQPLQQSTPNPGLAFLRVCVIPRTISYYSSRRLCTESLSLNKTLPSPPPLPPPPRPHRKYALAMNSAPALVAAYGFVGSRTWSSNMGS